MILQILALTAQLCTADVAVETLREIWPFVEKPGGSVEYIQPILLPPEEVLRQEIRRLERLRKVRNKAEQVLKDCGGKANP